MKRLLIGTTAALLFTTIAACSGSQKTGEQDTPQCLSYCSNQFAACTEEHPGDFSACRGERADCENACQEQKAMERMEGGDDDVFVDPPTREEPQETPSESEPEPTPEMSDGASAPEKSFE